MQTRKFGLRALTLAMAGVLTLGLAACEETKTVTPLEPTVLDISPVGPLELVVGEQVTIVSSLANAPAGTTVTFTSSNTAVATVAASGTNATIRAVAPGITTISATATGNQGTISRAITVRVRAATTPTPTPTDSARISIVSVVDQANNPVDPANTRGNIFVRVDYTRGAAQRVQVLVNNTVACEQTFGAATTSQIAEGANAALAAVEFVCPINTARIDPASGAPTFPNGDVTITARLVGANNAVLAQANTRQYTLSNPNNIQIAVTAERQGIGGNGLQWNDGAVTVTATPAIFTAGTTIARISVQAVNATTGANIGTAREDTDASNGLSVVFPESGTNSLAGVSTSDLVFNVTAVTSTGQQFQFPTAAGGTTPTRTTTAMRYDNVSPNAPAFTDASGFNNAGGTFVGSGFAFSGSGSNSIVAFAGERDPGETASPPQGSNSVAVTFAFLANNTANNAVTTGASQDTLRAAFNRGTQVTTGSQVPQATSRTAYILVAQVRDAVGNTTFVRAPGTFGADPNAPTISFVTGTVANNAVNPAGPIVVSVTEDISGPAANPIEVQAIRTTPSGETCYNVRTQAAVNRTAAGTCPFIALPTTDVPVPTAEGYFTLNVRARDVAGNVSEPISRFILVDRTDPASSVSSVTTATEQVTLSGTVTDNIDLMQYEARLNFGATTLTFAAPTMVSDFGLPAVGTSSATASVPLIRGLQATSGSGAPAGITAVNGASLSVFDVAGNFGAGTAATIASPTPSDGVVLNTFRMTNTDPTEICRPGSNNAVCTRTTNPVPTTRTLTAVATGPAGTFNNPFTTVYFYREIRAGVFRLIGSTTTGSIQTTETERRFSYSVTLNAADLADVTAGSTFNVIAVGVDSERDAIMSQRVGFTLR